MEQKFKDNKENTDSKADVKKKQHGFGEPGPRHKDIQKSEL